MKYELTKDRLEEIACCIVDTVMDRDEACDYILAVASECIGDHQEITDIEK
jgi:hypothetical protein